LNSHYLIRNDVEAKRRIDNIYQYKIKKQGHRKNWGHPGAFLKDLSVYSSIKILAQRTRP